MATRAAFYLGKPGREGAEILGCIAYDGYPADEHVRLLHGVTSRREFEARIRDLADAREDWTPAASGFPFPWEDDVFITDWVYAWFDDRVNATSYHNGWAPFAEWAAVTDDPPEGLQELRPTPTGCRRCAPGEGHDSIITVEMRKGSTATI